MGTVRARLEGSERVYLGLGSNLGDRESNLRHALELLGGYIALEKTSSVYDTEPWGYRDQPRFLNCVCEGRTSLQPQALLEAVKKVETEVGRVPTFPSGPRLVDVDILFYGQRLVNEPGLEIPHPRLSDRAFVLVPLVEIASEHLHPGLGLTVGELLRRLTGCQSINGDLPEGIKFWAGTAPVSRQS